MLVPHMAKRKKKVTRFSNRELKSIVAEDGVKRTTLSFYRYVRITDPEKLRAELVSKLGALKCLGRIYLASEGINAQMNVPRRNFKKFDAYIQSIPGFAGIPYKIAVEETGTVSFYKLTVKVREKIVADGLDDRTFDVTKTGTYLTAGEMNAYIDDPESIIVDMRNGYESEVGHFERAITPDVDTFREELKVVPTLLRLHKDKRIALYCTGGIRCEKASAWLRHKGFTNVKHLKGGIIDYKRQVDKEKLPNRFKGKNFVFDERMGERISDEVIAHCHLCGTAPCDEHVHCKNEACHVLYIGCDTCKENMGGYCSHSCMVFDMLPESLKKKIVRNSHTAKPPQFKKHRLRITAH